MIYDHGRKCLISYIYIYFFKTLNIPLKKIHFLHCGDIQSSWSLRQNWTKDSKGTQTAGFKFAAVRWCQLSLAFSGLALAARSVWVNVSSQWFCSGSVSDWFHWWVSAPPSLHTQSTCREATLGQNWSLKLESEYVALCFLLNWNNQESLGNFTSVFCCWVTVWAWHRTVPVKRCCSLSRYLNFTWIAAVECQIEIWY